jgi:DNA segregation ATPase FtsK/SpoIIIE-like protein
VIDEAADLCTLPGAGDVAATLMRIARLGRQSRVHLAIGMQQASAYFFGKAATEARSNFGTAIALGRTSRTTMTMLGIELAVPATPPGRAVLLDAGGERLSQVFWTPRPSSVT